MSKLLVIDADTILYSSAAQQQINKCLATNIEYGSQRLFESKTAFNKWLETKEDRTKDMYTFQTVSEIKPDAEPRFAFQSIKQKVDKIVEAAGFEIRQPGCSACLAMNDDKIPARKYSVSTSNRNFEGRQGPGSRTILASPLVAAAAAITGKITDPRTL